jgi:hypothetical protein
MSEKSIIVSSFVLILSSFTASEIDFHDFLGICWLEAPSASQMHWVVWSSSFPGNFVMQNEVKCAVNTVRA